MAKEKDEDNLFYSPKNGTRTKITNRRVSYFVELIDILSKLKTDTIEIREDFMYASDGNTAVKVLMRLGIDATVDRKELKKVIKPIDSEFSTTLHEDRIEFAWGEGNVTSIEILEESELHSWKLGKEIAMFDDEDFYHSLVCGGAGVSADGKGRLGFVHYDGMTVNSTDNIVLSQSEYRACPDKRCQFAISGKALDLWKAINLPTKHICVYENGTQIMLRDDVVIWDKSEHYSMPLLSQALNNRVNNFKVFADKKFNLPNTIWKSLAMFKNCKEITLKNNEIVSDDGTLKISTEIAPFDDDNDYFSIAVSEFFRLKPLIIALSDLSVIKVDVGPHINTFLYVEPDPGIEDVIIIGGIAEEKK